MTQQVPATDLGGGEAFLGILKELEDGPAPGRLDALADKLAIALAGGPGVRARVRMALDGADGSWSAAFRLAADCGLDVRASKSPSPFPNGWYIAGTKDGRISGRGKNHAHAILAVVARACAAGVGRSALSVEATEGREGRPQVEGGELARLAAENAELRARLASLLSVLREQSAEPESANRRSAEAITWADAVRVRADAMLASADKALVRGRGQ
ncbi:conserved protein of unknown function (plasmid) [Rhodovastum atsumiense]|uniref:Uncharacterized protein n=1 Tax=Rhodovastum atsumiense TaxID=504468 RepID=A0A5M6IVC4_9PROT|nr:hypothetical protein [Rhodovastum atsumiense]KAA5611797.1 hypothetical protein F1189_12210 [Rhodovastum atsumiense]CAH2606095.1 conserved protein of unknown function [Rhodovastum atsumiense]